MDAFILFLIFFPLLTIALSVPTFYLLSAVDNKIAKFFKKRTILGEILKWIIFILFPIFIYFIAKRTIPCLYEDPFEFACAILMISMFSITTLHLFKGIEKLTIKLFKKRTILGEALKWIIFAPLPFVVFFVFYFLISLESSHYLITIGHIKRFFSFLPLGALYFYGCIFAARIVTLSIKKLIIFILKKAKRQDRAETVADVMSWTLFMFIYLIPIFDSISRLTFYMIL